MSIKRLLLLSISSDRHSRQAPQKCGFSVTFIGVVKVDGISAGLDGKTDGGGMDDGASTSDSHCIADADERDPENQTRKHYIISSH